MFIAFLCKKRSKVAQRLLILSKALCCSLRDVLLLELIGVHEYHQSDWFVLSK